MKKTALYRATPLARGSRIAPRSRKRVAVMRERRKFVAAFLPGRQCEARDLGECFGVMTVHERVRRSKSPAAFIPGPAANAVGQTWHALCVRHHDQMATNPVGEDRVLAKARGWI